MNKILPFSELGVSWKNYIFTSLEEEGMATHSSILVWRIPMERTLVGYSPWGHKESDTTEQLSTAHTYM